jgi:hypothetical protein
MFDTAGARAWPPERFFFGANLPWLKYGCDFGASAWFPGGGIGARPDELARFGRILDRLPADSVSVVRLFLLCDLRSGIRFDAGGDPLGLDEVFFRDADAVFDIAALRGMRLLPVLLDFHLCAVKRVIKGVQTGGRRRLLTDPLKWDHLLSRVISPIVDRYGQHSAIAAWDLFNEPDWCTRSFHLARLGAAVEDAVVRECLGRMADCVHSFAQQPVTIGLASVKGLNLVRGLGLDFYQVHWYKKFGWSALCEPVARFGLEAPIVLGEFPGRGASVAPVDILSTARAAGFAGALVWSLESHDRASFYAAGLATSLGL